MTIRKGIRMALYYLNNEKKNELRINLLHEWSS